MFSDTADPSNCIDLPIAVVSLNNCNLTQPPAAEFSASPVTITCTGYPLVVKLVLTIVAPEVVTVLTFEPSVWL